MAYCITFNDVEEAARRIEGSAHLTPVLTSASMNRSAPGGNRQFFFKNEAGQRTGSFKFRGALNAIRSILETQDPAPSHLALATHSSGNHAQALALAAKLSSTDQTKVHATIVMPQNTPMVKKNAVQDFGAEIVMVASTNEARAEETDRIVKETGAIYVHPSENPLVIAGQGTVCLEFVKQVRDMGHELDAVIIPVGGGGLGAGNTIALRALLGDKVKIILAEPSVLDDAKRSFEAKELLKHAPDNKLDSVADGLKTTLGPNTWPILRDLVDDVQTVTEEEILRATKLTWERLKVCIEPSAGKYIMYVCVVGGCEVRLDLTCLLTTTIARPLFSVNCTIGVGVAVALSDHFNEKYSFEAGIRNVGIVLCGGNVDVLKIATRMQDMGL
jgi:serine racemase